eukprot:3213710-Amphidinium_carterae.1
MLLGCPAGVGSKQFLRLHGYFSPSIRAADGTTGEAIAAVLRTCPHVEDAALLEPFKIHSRVSEADEAPANARAERLWSAHAQNAALLQLFCVPHKVHTCTEKTWLLCPAVLTGSVRTLLTMQSAAQVMRVQCALDKVIEERLKVSHEPLTPEAAAHRSRILSLW